MLVSRESIVYLSHHSSWPRWALEASIVWKGGTKFDIFAMQLTGWERGILAGERQREQRGTVTSGGRGRGLTGWKGKKKRLLVSVVFGVCYCLAPLHSRGGRWEKKAACLVKGAGGWSQGSEWRREGGGGRRQGEQQHSSAISERRLQTLVQDSKKAGLLFFFPPFVLDYSLPDILPLGIWFPPGAASFNHQMRRSRNIHSL